MSKPHLKFILPDGSILEVPDLPGAIFSLERYLALKAKLRRDKTQ